VAASSARRYGRHLVAIASARAKQAQKSARQAAVSKDSGEERPRLPAWC